MLKFSNEKPTNPYSMQTELFFSCKCAMYICIIYSYMYVVDTYDYCNEYVLLYTTYLLWSVMVL